MKKLLAVFVLLALLSIVSCGKHRNTDDPSQKDGPDHTAHTNGDPDSDPLVYSPTVYPLESDDFRIRDIEGSAVTEHGIYLVAHIQRNDPGGPRNYSRSLLCMDLDTGMFHEVSLNDIKQPISVADVHAGEDNTLWVTAEIHQDETFIPKLYHLDQEDQVIQELDASPLVRDGSTLRDLIIAQSGTIWLIANEHLSKYTPELDRIWSVSTGKWINSGALLSDGRLGLYKHDIKADTMYVVAADEKDGTLKDVCTIEQQVSSQMYPGSANYLFHYTCGGSLYGWSTEANEPERILRWSDVDVDKGSIRSVDTMEDGRLVVVLCDLQDRDTPPQVVVLEKVPRSTLPAKTHLTMAAIRVSPQLERAVRAFNLSNNNVRIELRDYSELDVTSDRTAGMNKLITEIIAGEIPDLLVTEGMPIDDLCRQGLLVDLWPYIDGDSQISREGLMIRPLEAASRNGILPQVFPRFTISTVIGAQDTVGDRMGWTIKEARQMIDSLPQNVYLFDPNMTKMGMLTTLIGIHKTDLVDQEAGKCYFDSDEFRQILDFSDQFSIPKDSAFRGDQISPDESVYDGISKFLVDDVPSLQDIQYYRALLHGEFSFIGWPTLDGRTGSAFRAYDGVAMTVSCRDRDAAWQFLRTLLLAPDDRENMEIQAFSICKEVFDRAIETAMTPVYETDLFGNTILDPNGDPKVISHTAYMVGGTEIWLYAAEQADLDKLMELYLATDRLIVSDNDLDSIAQTADAFFLGDNSLEEAARLIQGKASIYVSEKQ